MTELFGYLRGLQKHVQTFLLYEECNSVGGGNVIL